MVEQLINIDAAKFQRRDIVVSWKSIAFEIGVSKATLQRWCEANGIDLPHWGPLKRSPVFLPRAKIVILKTLYFA